MAMWWWWICLLLVAVSGQDVPVTAISTTTSGSTDVSECVNSGKHPECSCTGRSSSAYGLHLQCTTGSDSSDIFGDSFIINYFVGEEDATLSVDCPCDQKAEGDQNDTSDYISYMSEVRVGPISSIKIKFCPLHGWGQWLGSWNVSHSLRYLTLRTCHPVSTMDSNSFQGLGQLIKLEISSNDLIQLPGKLFSDLVHLEELWLRDNKLEAIDGSMLAHLKTLRLLELGSNNISSISKEAFNSLANLRQLNLQENNLKNLPPGIFEQLINLDILDLSSNQLSELDANLFSPSTKLIRLGLRNNLLPTLPVDIFQNNLKLEKLFLQRNTRLSSLPADVFANLSSLKDLNLADCNLTDINPSWFSRLVTLETLDLSGNRISFLASGSFSGLRNLKSLTLDRNGLKTLDNLAFRSLGGLKMLSLGANKLAAIPADVFYPLVELTDINLAHNSLTFNEMEARLFYEGQSPLQNNLKLRTVDLSYNEITRMFSDWGNMNFLAKLNLSNNNLTKLEYQELAMLVPGIVLDLSYNRIYRADFDAVVDLDVAPERASGLSGGGGKQSTLYLDGNPLTCDCYTYMFVRYANRTVPGVRHSWSVEAPDLTCQEPEHLRSVPPTLVSPRLFTCPCPQFSGPCSCTKRPWDRTLLLDCRQPNVTAIPLVSLPGYKVHLKLGPELLDGLLNRSRNGVVVSSLDLSWNDLNSSVFDSLLWMNTSEHLPVLTRLDLSYNHLRSVPPAVLDAWNASGQLTLLLSGNPWECDCASRGLLNLRNRVEDYDRMVCKDGQPLSLADMLCPNAALRNAYIALPLLALLFLFVFVVVYRYRRVLVAWMYNRRICLFCVTKEEAEEDAERPYDAFISFSHKDEEFVIQELVPQLERPSSGEPSFRLCLHYRDWLAGEWIPEQISRSVSASKRTIVILSEHFLDSVWGQLEFRTAYQQVLTDRRMRLIVIVVGDLPPKDKMDQELKSYLALNTYLKWGDPWFWHRLRYALPHKRSTKKGGEDQCPPVGSRLSQAILEHGSTNGLHKEQANGVKLNQLPPLPLLTDRAQHRAHVILPPDIEMSLTPTSSASSTAPIFPINAAEKKDLA